MRKRLRPIRRAHWPECFLKVFISLLIACFFPLSLWGKDIEEKSNVSPYSLTGGAGFRTLNDSLVFKSNRLTEFELGANYSLKSNLQIGIRLKQFSGSIPETWSPAPEPYPTDFSATPVENYSSSSLRISGNSLTAILRNVPSRYFYIDSGAEWLDISAKYRASYYEGFHYDYKLGGYRRLSAVMSIGSQWQSSRAVLGVDWTSLLWPLSAKEEQKRPYFYSRDSVRDFYESKSKFQFELLKIYAGWRW